VHASQEQHAETCMLPLEVDLRDDDSYHSGQIENLISKYDLEEHEHACAYPEPRPKLAQSTL